MSNKVISKPKPITTIEAKKRVLRNPKEKSLPKATVAEDLRVDTPKSEPSETQEQFKELHSMSTKTYSAPELNSTLRIARKIESLEGIKSCKVRHLSDLPTAVKEAAEEQVAKRVNFPYNKQIYKDLIPLEVSERPKILISKPSRPPKGPRDEEPALEDFWQPYSKPEYVVTPELFQLPKTVNCKFDGLRVYKIIRSWNEEC